MAEKIVTIAGETRELRVERDGNAYASGEQRVEIVSIDGGEAIVRLGDRTHAVAYVANGSEVWFSLDGEVFVADVSEKGSRTRARHRDQSMSAPMPGVVLKLLVAPGTAVEKGTPLLILEAMKMEHTITAPHAGTVVAFHCREGELVQPGVELVEMSAAE